MGSMLLFSHRSAPSPNPSIAALTTTRETLKALRVAEAIRASSRSSSVLAWTNLCFWIAKYTHWNSINRARGRRTQRLANVNPIPLIRVSNALMKRKRLTNRSSLFWVIASRAVSMKLACRACWKVIVAPITQKTPKTRSDHSRKNTSKLIDIQIALLKTVYHSL